MKRKKPKHSGHLVELMLSGILDTEEDYVRGGRFQQQMFPAASRERLVFDDCEFHKVDFTELEIGEIEFLDCTFRQCDFSNADLRGSRFFRCECYDSKLMGTNFTRSLHKDVLYDQCLLRLANFAESKIEQTDFLAGVLVQGSFISGKLKDVFFTDCDIDQLNLWHGELKNVDIATSRAEKLDIDASSLKGLVVSSEQAVYFAKFLGLVIRDV